MSKNYLVWYVYRTRGFKTRNHLEKFEKYEKKKLRLKKLHKISKLESTDDLYFACLKRFECHYQFFRLNFGYFNFCEILIPDFQNLHYP